MKLAFYKTARMFCPMFRYLLSALLVLTVSVVMTCQVVPISVSLFVSYLGFADDAPVAAILLMAGIPSLFMTGLMLYGTIRFLSVACRVLADYFVFQQAELTRKIDLGGGTGKPKKGR